jgi:hypothetical protein
MARMALRKLLLPVFKPVRPLWSGRILDCMMRRSPASRKMQRPPSLLSDLGFVCHQ